MYSGRLAQGLELAVTPRRTLQPSRPVRERVVAFLVQTGSHGCRIPIQHRSHVVLTSFLAAACRQRPRTLWLCLLVSGCAHRHHGESHLHVHAMLSTCWQQDVNLRVSTRRTPTSGTNGRPESALPQTAKFDPRRDERTSNIPRLRLTAFAASRSPRDK